MKRIAIVVITILSALPVLAQRRRAAAPPSSEAGLTFTQWTARRAIPFATVEPIDDDSDLMPLLSIVGNRKYVGVGEATHGSHEFFAMKSRMFRFLVRNMGFTVFSIEGNLPEADAINDYVQTGVGDPVALVHGMHFWTWEVEELEDLVVWMHDYNVAHPDRPRLSFRGFDMQYSQAAVAAIDAYVERVDPANAATIEGNLVCANIDGSLYQTWPIDARNACHTKVLAAYQAIAGARPSYIAASSAPEYERMLRYARLVVQFENLMGHATNYGEARDSSMAENAEWIAEVEHPGEKMMMWAHNYHIGRMTGIQMGAYVHDHWPDDHMAFGFVFDHGDFNARDTTTRVLEKKHADSVNDKGYDSIFRTFGMPRFILDLRNPPDSVFDDLFLRGKPTWDIGAIFPVPREVDTIGYEWDVIIWVEESTASHLR